MTLDEARDHIGAGVVYNLSDAAGAAHPTRIPLLDKDHPHRRPRRKAPPMTDTPIPKVGDTVTTYDQLKALPDGTVLAVDWEWEAQPGEDLADADAAMQEHRLNPKTERTER